MNWAMQDVRCDGPSAQCVLYVIADVANERGVSLYSDPDYIAERTRQSRATVFRRLDELERKGALTRFVRHNSDGRRVYEVRLHLDRSIDYDAISDAEHEDSGGESQIETLPSESQIETGGGESHPCDSVSLTRETHTEESVLESKIPPNPPLGGFHASEAAVESFKPFLECYPAPITDMPKALALWVALSAAERAEALTGAKGYRSYIEAERRANRNRAVKDAHRWLKDRQWTGYLIAGKSAEALEQRFSAPMGSPQANAWDVFYRCCGEIDGIPKYLISVTPAGRVARVPREWPPLVGEATEWKTWIEGTPQFAAWLRRLCELPDVQIRLRTQLIDGKSVRVIRVPGEFPPAKGGMTGVG
jgi:DNA-binding Lrp family transcriptional regulator